MMGDPYNGSNYEWVANANAIQMQRGVDALRKCFDPDVAFMIGAAVIPAIRESRARVSQQCDPWFT